MNTQISDNKAKTYFQKFITHEQSSGILLISATLLALVLANSPLAESVHHLWATKAGIYSDIFTIEESIEHWINDFLMAIFFLMVGLEIKREVLDGELSSIAKASLPVSVALGGMIFPALFYYLINRGTPTVSGWGIPMATDIAFALGVLTLLGSRVPNSLKVFLVALAVADDLGAIAVIAIFYNQGIDTTYVLYALGVLAALFACNKLKVNALSVYILLGLVLWYFVHKSGIHATIAGVLLAFTMPADLTNHGKCLLHKLEDILMKPVNFIILPLFALVNTGISLIGSFVGNMTELNSLGILCGLYLGKVVGIVAFTYLAAFIGLAPIPKGAHFANITGIGFLGGIGFTMSIFVTNLSFSDPDVINASKMAILFTSLLAGITGYLILKWAKRS